MGVFALCSGKWRLLCMCPAPASCCSLWASLLPFSLLWNILSTPSWPNGLVLVLKLMYSAACLWGAGPLLFVFLLRCGSYLYAHLTSDPDFHPERC